jgi:hypothetical protein
MSSPALCETGGREAEGIDQRAARRWRLHLAWEASAPPDS